MNIQLHHADNLEIMKTLPDESIDVICIDPPYLYLKNQKLERLFNERFFFIECARLLTKNGFIVMFGRGDSFYRWNNLLNNLIEYKEGAVKYGYKVFDENGNIINKYKFKENIFTFKEEIVWNKSYCTSPLMNLSRVHETVAIFTKEKGTINKVKVPYMEMKSHDIHSIIGDVKRMRSILKNTKSLNAVLDFLENNVRDESDNWEANNISISSKITKEQREVSVARSMKNGLNEKSIISSDFYKTETFAKSGVTTDVNSAGDRDRCVKVINSFEVGMNEKSIIKQVRDHYSAIHPTQKPVRLLERLLKLVIPMKKKKIVVADYFGGSFSCCEAVINLQSEFPDIEFEFIGTEIDLEYFLAGKERIENIFNND